MFILSQDKDTVFSLSDKGLFRSQVYTEDHYVKGQYFGCNIYGKNFFGKYLLGTYEEEEAEQVVSEIYKLMKAGARYYSMPDGELDPEDLGVPYVR